MTLRAQLRLSLFVSLAALASSCVADLEGDGVGGQSFALSPVTWTNIVNVNATGNDLAKSTATAWNSGASSVETLAGDGYVEFTTAEANRYKTAGLNAVDTTQHYNEIDFCIALTNGGLVRVYENGVSRGSFGTYVASDLFRVEVASGAVRYYRNGVLFYTSFVAPTFPLVVDTALYTSGATVNAVVIENSQFQNLVNVTATGNDLQKTGGGSLWTAGAATTKTISGDGYVQFVANGTNAFRMGGLSNGDSSPSYTDIDFAIYLMTTSRLRVYEAGVSRGLFGTYNDGDVMRVSVTGGVVRYSRNGTVFYTSTRTPTFPLLGDFAFKTLNSRIDDVEISEPPLWQNLVDTVATGNDLVKSGTTVGWNAGASTVASLSGDGFVEFTTTDITKYKAAGLSNGDSNQSYTDIDFAFYLLSSGRIRIYEAGVNRGLFGTYAAGDIFRVQNTGGVVTYYHNGVLVYTSTVTPTLPLLADTSLYHAGSTISDLVLSP
jgi:hypothetical protein